ncbi:MAG: BamA/TamA family outer membrane protein [Nitrospirae bacterium]|nr:BamA/TamA family outer membrane protein [Nitrospirota bacterium]
MIIKRLVIFLVASLFLLSSSQSFAGVIYNIDASFNPKSHTISGKVKITSDEPFVSLYLYPNIYATKDTAIPDREYDRIYPRDFNSGYIEIQNLTDSEGSNLPFRIEGQKNTILRIEGSKSEIVIEFKTRVPEKFGPFGYFKDIHTLAGAWHPYVVNPLFPPFSKYNITLTLPIEYNIAIPKNYIKDVKIENSSKTVYMEALNISHFDMIISKKLTETEFKKDGYSFTYYHLKKDRKYAASAVDTAFDAAVFFNKNFFEIKNKAITFGESYLHQDIVSPQENLILISNRFHKAYSYLKRFHDAQLAKGLYRKFWRDIIPKEEEEWVAEGLADYAMQMYILDKYKESPSLSGYLKPLAFIPLFDEILYSKKLPMRDIYFKEHNHLVVREDIRLFNNNRPDGAIIFQKLKSLIGKEQLDKIIDDYKSNLFKGEYKAFRSLSKEIANQDLDEFYHQWLVVNPAIDFAIKSVKKKRIGEKHKTEIIVERGDNGAEPVDIKAAYKDKTSDTYHWDGRDKEKKIEIESDKAVDSVILDPEKITSDPNRFNNRLPHRWKVLLDRIKISYDFQSQKLEFDVGASTTRLYDDHHFFVFNVFHKEEVDGANLEYGYNFGGYDGEDKPLHTLSTKIIFEKLSEKFAVTAKDDEYINAVGLSYRYDTYRASVEYADKFLNGDYSYFKGLLDLRKELRIANKHSIAGRALIGQSEGDLPEHTKFLLGGINGMRGYTKSDYKGNNISLFSLEYRFPIIYDHDLNLLSLIIVHTAQGAIFADAGMVSDNRNTFKFKDYKTDVGTGLRFHVDLFGIYPGIGRIDFAIPVGETEKSRNVHVYLSIGQSF